MGLTLSVPAVDQLDDVVAEVASWQQDDLPVQLHPGDLGWHQRFGPATLAAALRVWARDQRLVAVGFLDGSSLVRMAIAPWAADDPELAQAIVLDLEDPARGVVEDAEEVVVEARFGPALRGLLPARGWADGECWTPLVRDLGAAVEEPSLRVEFVGREHVEDRVEVQRAAFDSSTFTTEAWHEMARSRAYREARCLVGYADDQAVAAVTVWSAGQGRPGLLEPMGVHRDHRGQGHGTAITVAAAAALRHLGASSALVATPSANAGAVATYAAAGYRRMPQVTDFVHTR